MGIQDIKYNVPPLDIDEMLKNRKIDEDRFAKINKMNKNELIANIYVLLESAGKNVLCNILRELEQAKQAKSQSIEK